MYRFLPLLALVLGGEQSAAADARIHCGPSVLLGDLIRDAPVIVRGTVSSLESFPEAEDRECVWLVVEEYLRGDGAPGSHRVCYRLGRRAPDGSGVPPVASGEPVVVFAVREVAGELVAAAEQNSVISPSIADCLLGSGRAYADFQDVVVVARRGAAYVDGDPETQREVAVEFAESGSLARLLFLVTEAARVQGGTGRSLSFDPAAVIPALIKAAGNPDHQAAMIAFDVADELDQLNSASGWFVNELFDVALEWMAADKDVLRGRAHVYAFKQWQAEAGAAFLASYGYDTEPFGYDPFAPEQARAEPLRRWREWWAAHRGRGMFDTSPERMAERRLQLEEDRRRYADMLRRKGEALVRRVELGLETIDPSDPYFKYQLQELTAAGYEVAPDGSVVPIGSLSAGSDGEAGDAGEQGAGASGDETAAEAEPAADSGEPESSGAQSGAGGEKRRGCGGCATAGDGSLGLVATALVVAALLMFGGRSRRR